jgi:hypothetical protein
VFGSKADLSLGKAGGAIATGAGAHLSALPDASENGLDPPLRRSDGRAGPISLTIIVKGERHDYSSRLVSTARWPAEVLGW